MSWISIDVDLDDIYREMSRYDKEKMAEWLEEDGHCIIDYEYNNKENPLYLTGQESYGEEELKNNLKKLWNSYYQLSNEDIETIKKIANKI